MKGLVPDFIIGIGLLLVVIEALHVWPVQVLITVAELVAPAVILAI
jgi:hypothetical protein